MRTQPKPETFVPMFDKPRRGRQSANIGWVVVANGCHIWQGGRTRDGYGVVHIDGRHPLVHRARYEREVGPIPDGMQLDHFVCNNPLCCNPEHVRPTTPRENTLRGTGLAAQQAAQTHCIHGHPFSGDNLYVSPTGHRRCRTCDRARDQRRAKRKRNPTSDGAPSDE